MKFAFKEITTEMEKKIITGLIVSDQYCRSIIPIITSDFIESSYISKVVSWVKNYWKNYEKAPRTDIQEIFDNEESNLSEDEFENISKFLSNLSKVYEQEEDYNWEYQIDVSKDFIRRKSLDALSEKIQMCLERKDTKKAEELVSKYKEITDNTSNFIFLFDDEEFIERVCNEDDENEEFFKLEGDVGEMIGGFRRGWLVAFLAPMKRGKTAWMTEIGLQAVMSRLTVVHFCLEMSAEDMSRRIIKRVTGSGEKIGKYKFPVFDCKKNQDDECDLPQRVNHIPLRNEMGEIPDYRLDMPYKPCDVCRNLDPAEYKPESWFSAVEKDKTYIHLAQKRAKSLKRLIGSKKYVLQCYPRFSATLQDIEADLDELEFLHGIVPDVVIVDYADILSTKGLKTEKRDQYDEIWKTLAKLAGEKKCVVVTASQARRDTLTSGRVSSADFSEDIRKLAHVDVAIGLQQTRSDDPEKNEKEKKRMRIKVLEHRHNDHTDRECIVLQQLSLGQVCLDSYFKPEFQEEEDDLI